MVLREHNDPLNQSRGIMGALENSNVQNNRGRLRQRFDLIRKLGQGTYGKVQLGIDKETGQEVAIKTIKKSKIETEADLIRIRREIQIMSSVRHPNIIHIYEVFENREKMVLVMEYAAGGELYDYLNERKILQEDEARRIFRQIASAVYYCHKLSNQTRRFEDLKQVVRFNSFHKICHRDLKLENILLDEASNAKIADFGLSNVFDDVHLLKTFCGSPLYASPEIVKGTPYFGPEVDCWSLGVLLYTLVYGAMPFDGSNFKRLVKQISNGDYYEPKKPAEASPLIKIMLTVDPLTRATIKDVCSHAWINFSFDKQCLGIAEELANQTPVRLDLLLSLAPAYNINHSQVVIESPNAEGAASTLPPGETAAAANNAGVDSSNAIVNHEKAEKKQGEGKEKTKEAPAKPKRKIQQVKTKSKSSPLLDLIMDEEDEQGDNDDEGDTLSEISEIQTIAEDLAEIKGKGKLKESKDKLQQPKISVVQKPEKAAEVSSKLKTKTGEEKKAAESVVLTPVKPAVDAKPAESKFTVKKVVEKKDEVIAVENKPEEKAVSEPPKTPVVKKKVVKAKPAEVPPPPPPTAPVPPSPVTITAPPAPKEEKAAKVEESVKKEETVQKKDESANKVKEESAKKEEKKEEIKKEEKKDESSSPEPVSKQGEKPKEEKEGTPTPSRPKMVKQRSDSSSEVSPTRIERRNSKVISQKTAELIQNLNTKTSTNSTSEPVPKAKKLVIPSFKVSDAKSRFEAKPPRPINVSSLSKSRAAIEAKLGVRSSDSETEGTKKVVKPADKTADEKDKIPEPKADDANKKRKSKSPSPRNETAVVDSKEKTETDAKTNGTATSLEVQAGENKEKTKSPTVSPKPKPKIMKKPTVEKEEASKRDLGPSPEPSTLSEDISTKTTTDDQSASTISQSTAPTITDIAIKSTKVVPPKTVKSSAEQQMKPVLLDTGSGAPKTAMMLVKGKTTPSPQTSPPESAVPTTTDPLPAALEASADNSKPPKLLTKLPPQNKEQAAKKISSVITKIVTSGSKDKELNEDKKFSTLPRNAKLSKAPETPTGAIKSEIVAPVGESGKPKVQKTEVSFPVAAAASQERIIPIKLVDETSGETTSGASSRNTSTTHIPRLPPRLDSFKRMDSANSAFSRQNSSDTESSMALPLPKPEAIRKSPREFLIPIKLEASGQTVTPKEDIAAEASTAGSMSSMAEDDFRMDSRLRSGRFGRQKRYSSLLSDSSLDDEPSVSATTSRRSSAVSSALPPSHVRSRSQGDEPDTTSAAGTFKRYRMRRSDMPLDRSDSFSSAEEDEEDAFEVLTAESLFSNLLDRVRNLTRRLNREDSVGPSWASTTSGSDPPGFALWGNSPLREFMARAPSESRSYASTTPGTYSMSHHRAFSREPSVSMTVNPGSGGWRRSLSRELSGDSDTHSASVTSHNAPSRNLGGLGGRRSEIGGETTSVRSLPLNLAHARRSSPSFYSQRSESGDSSITSSSAGAYHPQTSRPYGRTMSNTDFASPTSTHTLPFHRRSLKSYDRNYGERDRDYSSNMSSSTMSPQMESMVGAVRGIASRLVEPTSSYSNMNGSPYFSTRLRSLSRETPDRERSLGPSAFANNCSKNDMGPEISASSGECNNGWVGGSNSSLATSSNLSNNSSGSGNKLSVQEKMNNYQQFYHSLSNNINPEMRRFQLLNTSQQVHQSSPVRPNTMYETSFINNDIPPNIPVEDVPEETVVLSKPLKPTTPVLVSPPSLSPPVVDLEPEPTATLMPPPIVHPQMKLVVEPSVVKESEPVPPETAPITSPTTTNQSHIPKWPNVSIKQHRPLSISSFPSTSERSKSVSKVASPTSSDTKNDVTINNNANETNIVKPVTSSQCPSTPKLKREVRATSVERITRFLERKSVPREIPTATKEKEKEQAAEGDKSGDKESGEPIKLNSPQKCKSASKISSKPKFLQSLEKKWEKLTTHTNKEKSETSPTAESEGNREQPSPKDSPVPPSDTPEPPSEDSLTEESNVKQVSESVLLQRAVSPEKKPKSKFGASTVNFMLGKFRKFEENTLAPSSQNQSVSRIPSGKPPSGTSSRIGRRVQSVYAGTISDSVLTLPREIPQPTATPQTPQKPVSPPPQTPVVPPPQQKNTTAPIPEVKPVCNGSNSDAETLPNINSIKQDAVELIKSAEVAQMKRKSVVTHLTPLANSNIPQVTKESTPVENTLAPVESKPRRPHSLGIFSHDNGSNGSRNSFIPRFQRQNGVSNGDALSPTEKISPKSPLNLPEINIQETFSNKRISENGENNVEDNGLSPMTPTSVSDSIDDSSSVCSNERTEQSMIRSMSVLDEEESVSDRIFRKSFYNRFNSLDRKRSASTTAARQLTSPSPSRQSVNGNHKSSKTTNSSSSLGTSGIVSSATTISTGLSSVSSGGSGPQRSPSPNLLLSKYNPNPLFKELITDDYKSDVGRKAEYSRRVTSKLSKLLREIDTDINKSCTGLKDSPVLNGFGSNESHNNLVNHHKAIHNTDQDGSSDLGNSSENGNDHDIENSFSLESEK